MARRTLFFLNNLRTSKGGSSMQLLFIGYMVGIITAGLGVWIEYILDKRKEDKHRKDREEAARIVCSRIEENQKIIKRINRERKKDLPIAK